MSKIIIYLDDKYRPNAQQKWRKGDPLTFQGMEWRQMSKGERIASIKWCVQHMSKRGHVHHKWIQQWLEQFWHQLTPKAKDRILKEI